MSVEPTETPGQATNRRRIGVWENEGGCLGVRGPGASEQWMRAVPLSDLPVEVRFLSNSPASRSAWLVATASFTRYLTSAATARSLCPTAMSRRGSSSAGFMAHASTWSPGCPPDHPRSSQSPSTRFGSSQMSSKSPWALPQRPWDAQPRSNGTDIRQRTALPGAHRRVPQSARCADP